LFLFEALEVSAADQPAVATFPDWAPEFRRCRRPETETPAVPLRDFGAFPRLSDFCRVGFQFALGHRVVPWPGRAATSATSLTPIAPDHRGV